MQVVIAQSVVITAYPVPQEMEEICECNYILFNIFKYKKKLKNILVHNCITLMILNKKKQLDKKQTLTTNI